MNENKENREIDAMQIVSMLLKSWWIIVIAVVLCVGLAIGYTEFLTVPKYRSSTTLLLNGGGEGTTVQHITQQILAGQYQSKDYPYILKANDTMVEIADKLNDYIEDSGIKPYRDGKYTARTISGMISSDSVDDSRIFRVVVTGTDPEEARLVAKIAAEVFIERVQLLAKVDVGVVDNPVASTTPISPGLSRNAIIGFVAGLVIGALIAILLGLSNDTIESEDWLINKYKDRIPLLSAVPDASAGMKSSYYRYKYKYSRSYGSRHNNQDSKK